MGATNLESGRRGGERGTRGGRVPRPCLGVTATAQVVLLPPIVIQLPKRDWEPAVESLADLILARIEQVRLQP